MAHQERWTAAEARAYFRQARNLGERFAVPPKTPIQPRHTPGQRNALEAAYEAEQLWPRLLAGEVLRIHFEEIKIKLADSTYYTPDFVVVTPVGVEVHEVKGFWRDDARVKWKVAAAQYGWMRFFAVTRQGRRGPWVVERYRGGREA